MNQPIIINKILSYLDYDGIINVIKVSKKWKECALKHIYPFECSNCKKNGRQVFCENYFSKKRIYLCSICNKNQNCSAFLPIIPLIPGKNEHHWITSDIHLKWKQIWWFHANTNYI